MKAYLILILFSVSTVTLAQEFEPLSFFSSDEIEEANTAQNADHLTEEEKNIFLFNNLARARPQKFHRMYLAYCKSIGRESELKTNKFYRTLAEDLENRQPVSLLLPDKKMFDLAECWAVESGEKGIVGHDRVTCPSGFSGENCAYGYGDGFKIVMQLLIDHSVESLGHRKNMLNASWRGLGTAIRPHTGYRVCAVQNFTRMNDVLRAEAEAASIRRQAEADERQRQLTLRAQKFDELMSEFSSKEKSAADVGRSLDYLTDFEKDFYFYFNLVRMYPKKFKKLIWDEGPYFDRFKEEQTDLKRQAGYQRFDKYLSSAQAKPAFIPEKKYMDAGRCAVKKWRAGSNSTSCLPGPGSWRLQTYFPESVYKDALATFMEEKDFNDLFVKGAHLIMVEEEYQAVKVFLR